MHKSRGWFWAAGLTTLVCIAPLLVALLAEAVAPILHCRLALAIQHPCWVAGHDISGVLQAMNGAGLLMMFTIWPLWLSFVLWIVAFFKRWQKRRAS